MEGGTFMVITGILLLLIPTEAVGRTIPGFPWDVSTEHPFSWTINEEQTQWTLNHHTFIKYQIEMFVKDSSLGPNEWSPWTVCTSCLLPLERYYFQLRYKGAQESYEMKKCEDMQPCLAESSFQGATYVGCWLYENLQHLTDRIKSDDALTATVYSNTAEDVNMRACAKQAAHSGNPFFFLQKDESGLLCIISNSTGILRYGETLGGCAEKGSAFVPVHYGRRKEPTVAFYALFSCPTGQEQITSHGECGTLRTAQRNASDPYICDGNVDESDPDLLTQYLESTRNYWNASVFTFKEETSTCTNVEPNRPIDVKGSVTECPSSVTALCPATGGTSLTITEWTSFDSCSKACGRNGTRSRYRYDLHPASRVAGNLVPINDTETESCNINEDCNLVDNEQNDDFRFVGCWEREGKRFLTPLEGLSPILDGIPLRRKHALEKCKIASNDYSASHIILSRGECYYQRFQNVQAYQRFGPSDECSYHGSTLSGFEIYKINSNDTIKSHFGAWNETRQCPGNIDCGVASNVKFSRSCNNPPPEEGVVLNDCPTLTEVLYETCPQDGCPNLYDETEVGCFQVSSNFEFVSFEKQVDKPIDCSFNAFKKQHDFAVFPSDDASRCFTGDLNLTVVNNQTWYGLTCSPPNSTRQLIDNHDSITVTVKLVSVGDPDSAQRALIESLRPQNPEPTTTLTASPATPNSTLIATSTPGSSTPPLSTVEPTTNVSSYYASTSLPSPAVPDSEEQISNNETLTNAQIGAIVGGTVGGAAATAGAVAILVSCLKGYDWASLLSTIIGCFECGDDEEKETTVNLTVNIKSPSGTSEQANAALDEETEEVA